MTPSVDPNTAGVLLQKASPLVKLLLQVGGVSGVIALYLVYTLAANVAKDARSSALMLSEHLRESSATGVELTIIRNLLLQSCINEARGNKAGIDGCFDAQYKTPSRR